MYAKALFAYRFVQQDVDISYAELGSGSGICRIESWATQCSPTDTAEPHFLDFADSDALLSATDYALFPDLQMYPTLASAVVPMYNLGGNYSLVLTPDALAQIFCGAITSWDDPAIVATNPMFETWGIPSGQRIEVVVRADGSGTTQIFKKSLAGISPEFLQQIGTSKAPIWANVTVTHRPQSEGVMSYVLVTPYTIGYVGLGDALNMGMPMASLNISGKVLAPSITALEYAVLELGLSFGNNGDNPVHLTADINNAKGVNAWPLAGYTYLIMRKDTLRPNATCADVKATMEFWHWFWTSDVSANIAASMAFCALPSLVQQLVVNRFLSDIQCQGSPVWEVPQPVVVSGVGPSSMQDLVQRVAQVYQLVDPNAVISYEVQTIQTNANINAALNHHTFVIADFDNAADPIGGVTLLFAGLGAAVVSNFNFVLDGPTLAQILAGQITTWLDPKIVTLNPGGLVNSSGSPLTNTNQKIQMIYSPFMAVTSFNAMMQQYFPSYQPPTAPSSVYATDLIVCSAVAALPFALSVVPDRKSVV